MNLSCTDAFIPAMTAPNMLPNISDDTCMHILPTVSYKSGSSTLLPILPRPMCNSNGLHTLFNQNAPTMMAMTMNNYPSKQPLITIPSTYDHPRAFLKSTPDFCNQNGQSPPSPIKNTMYQNSRPSFPTPHVKNVNFLPPLIQVPFKKQMSPSKDENMKHKIPNHCEIQHAYSSINQPLSTPNKIIQNIEEERIYSSNQENLNSGYGTLIKDYNEAQNIVEQVTRLQNNDQEALHTQFGALVKEFNEARNLVVIQSDEKKMRIQNMNNQQTIKDQDYDEQMINEECKNKKLTKEQNIDYHNHMMNFENEQLPKMYNDSHQQLHDFQNDESMTQLQNNNHEEIQKFQTNEQMLEIKKNGNEQMQNFQNKQIQRGHDQVGKNQNDEQPQKTQSNGNDQMKNFQNDEQISRIQNDGYGQVKSFRNTKQMSGIQNNDDDQTYQNITELSQMHRNGTGQGQIKTFLNSNEAKIKVFGAFSPFSPLNGLSNLSGLTPKELKIQKENELFTQMEKKFQQKTRMDGSNNKQDMKDEKDYESILRVEKHNYEGKMKIQNITDFFNNDEEIIKVHDKSVQKEKENSKLDHGEYESSNYNGLQLAHSTTSNNIDFKFNSPSNHIASSKQHSWLLQKNREDNESPSKPQLQRNMPRKVQVDKPSSPKKAHVSIRERIAQAAKQAIDDLVPEPLIESQMSECAPLLKLIDIYYVQCLQSKEWKLRDKALQYMVQEIKNEQMSGDALDIFRYKFIKSFEFQF